MSVRFAPTIALARRAARAGDEPASPRALAPLVRALASGEPVVVVEPARRNAAWEHAKRRILLPSAPGLLRDAIGGIAAQEPPAGPRGASGGATRAHWIPGDLTDRRAAAILAAPPVPLLWVLEDFRRLRIGRRMQAEIDRAGVRFAAYRALRVAPRRRGR